VVEFLEAGGQLTPEDEQFKDEYLAQQTEAQREYFLFRLDFCKEAK